MHEVKRRVAAEQKRGFFFTGELACAASSNASKKIGEGVGVVGEGRHEGQVS